MKEFRRYYNKEFENDVFNIVENSNDYNKLFSINRTFDYYYSFLYLRENLFSWYPFNEKGNLLEIGGGYGQLTNLFCSKVNNVVSVENSQKRSEIISKRCNYKNIKILTCDFSQLDINEKFDYIILCDIFEYAKNFYKSSNPYKDFLIYLKNFLKDEGVILIALNNRLGLKYFAGYKEEHTNTLFSSLRNFENDKNIQTFSKGELESIIKSAGFNNYKFFYPFPDHYFPDTINTEELINTMPYERVSSFYDERYTFFSEQKLNQTLSKDNISQFFSNSFLIEIRNSENNFNTDNLKFIKLNNDRKEIFRTITYIKERNNKLKVYKIPSSPFSINHVKDMNEFDFNFGKIRFLNSDFKNNVFSYDYLDEVTLEQLMVDTILMNNKIEFYKLLDWFFDCLFENSFISNNYATEDFLEVFKVSSKVKFHCHDKTNLDIIFSNLFVIENELVAIDYEWLFNFPIPLEYLLFRVISHHRKINPLFREFITEKEVFNHFNLDTKNFELFKKWEYNFLDSVFLKFKMPYNKSLDYKKNISKLQNTIKRQRKIINTMENSNSWKITKPLRSLRHIFKK